MIKKQSYAALLLFIALLLNSAANAQNRDAVSAGSKSFLWKVTSRTATAYVLGSIHLMKQDSYPLDDRIETAFDKSDVLAVEADINNLGQNDVIALITKAYYPNNDSLDKHISKATFDLVMREADRLGISPDILLKQKPWVVASSFEVLELMKLGFDPRYGIDEHFLMEAAGKKRIMEMESVDSQISLMTELSDSEQDALLYSTIKNVRRIKKVIDDLVTAWRTGDTGTVAAVMFEDTGNDPRLALINDKLITRRNRAMARKIEDMLKNSESYFIVIGAGHLVGDNGIIELLRKKGYAVEQL